MDGSSARDAREPTDPRHRRWWIASILYSLACLVAVVGVLYGVYTAPAKPDPADTVVTNSNDVTQYLAARLPAPSADMPPAITIPTGLYITLVESTGPYTVELAGQLWQRYADNLPKDLNKASSFPTPKINRFSRRCTASGTATKR